MDLNILAYENGKALDAKALISKIRIAFKLGYETVALNTVVDGSALQGKEIKIPKPLRVNLGDCDMPETKISGKSYRVLSRITAVVNETIQCHRLMLSPVTKEYDILAIQPLTEKLLQHISENLEIDLISLDLASKLPFYLKGKKLRQLTAKGVYFEIQYAPCVRDQTCRRNTISNANSLSQELKGKYVILTSAAEHVMELRSPHDVANLGRIFGLQENQAKAAVRENCRRVFVRSEMRRKTGKGIVSIEEASKLAESDQWLLKACDIANYTEVKESSDDSESADSESPPAKRAKV